MKRIIVEHQGKSLVVFAEKIGDLLWVNVQGETVVIPTNNKRKRRGHHDDLAAEAGDILAPMPGKVTQILIKEGDLVSKGQTLVVMEAMKMEYNLKAAKEGAVDKIASQIGQQVQLGQTLVHVRVKE